MKELRRKKGITLIALVVTIIVLIILAGVSISLVLGDNGIITRAKEAKSTYSIEAVREKVEMMLSEYVTENQLEEKDLDEFLNQKQEEGKIEEASDNGNGTHTIILDGYEVTIRDEDLEIIEIIEESEFRKLTRGKAKFIYTPQTKYVKSVNVSIEIEESVKMYTVQYKIGKEGEWVKYTDGEVFEITNSAVIYGRFIKEETNEKGYHFVVKIDNIDSNVPQKANITFDRIRAKLGETIQATIRHEDKESGIDINNCKYIINTSSKEIGVESAEWETAQSFMENPQVIEIAKSEENTFYLHVLSTDMQGLKNETVSDSFIFGNKTTILNTSSFGNVSDTEMSDWTITGSSRNDYMYTTPWNRDTRWAYATSNFNIDVTELKSLTFDFYLYVSCHGGLVHFKLCDTENTANVVKEEILTTAYEVRRTSINNNQYFRINRLI